MKLTEACRIINQHLREFERDPAANPLDPVYKTRSYYHAHCVRAGAFAMVTYVSYQGRRSLASSEAVAYARWLQAGNVGTHWMARRDA